MNSEILHQDIQTLLEYFSKNSYRASDSKNSDSFFVSISINFANYLLSSFVKRSLEHKDKATCQKDLSEKPLQSLRQLIVQIKIFASRIYAFKKKTKKTRASRR